MENIVNVLKHEGLSSIYAGAVAYGITKYMNGDDFVNVYGMEYSKATGCGLLTLGSSLVGKLGVDTFAGMAEQDPMTLRVESGMPNLVDPAASAAIGVGINKSGLITGDLGSQPFEDTTLAATVAGSVFLGDRIADMHFM